MNNMQFIKHQNIGRYWQYLEERFSLVQFITLAGILAIASSIATQKYYMGAFVDFRAVGVSFLAIFLFLFMLRLFDEFKDYHHDKEYYKHRPVSRGLVTLNELKWTVFVVVFFEFLIALISGGVSFFLFIFTFGYSLIMFKEFFVQEWLKKHFTAYIASHEVVLIPLFFYIYAINGLHEIANGVMFFSILTVFLGGQLFLLEVARKVRPVHLEIKSKDTYTAQYGIVGASALVVFLAFISTYSFFYLKRLLNINFATGDFLVAVVFVLLLVVVLSFFRNSTENHAKNIFRMSVAFFVTLSGSFVVGMII